MNMEYVPQPASAGNYSGSESLEYLQHLGGPIAVARRRSVGLSVCQHL